MKTAIYASTFVLLATFALSADVLQVTSSGVFLVASDASGAIVRTKIAGPVAAIWDDRTDRSAAGDEGKVAGHKVKPDSPAADRSKVRAKTGDEVRALGISSPRQTTVDGKPTRLIRMESIPGCKHCDDWFAGRNGYEGAEQLAAQGWDVVRIKLDEPKSGVGYPRFEVVLDGKSYFPKKVDTDTLIALSKQHYEGGDNGN